MSTIGSDRLEELFVKKSCRGDDHRVALPFFPDSSPLVVEVESDGSAIGSRRAAPFTPTDAARESNRVRESIVGNLVVGQIALKPVAQAQEGQVHLYLPDDQQEAAPGFDILKQRLFEERVVAEGGGRQIR